MTPDWPAVRRRFPAAEKYAYLNTASGGIVGPYAAAAAKQYFEEAHGGGDVWWDDWCARAEAIRAQTARFVGAAPEEVAFLPNASLGLNLAAQGFDGTGVVLTTAAEFPSCTLPWLRRGHDVRFLPLAADGGVPLDGFAAALTPDVRFLVMSLVQYRTGYRYDLEALGRLCRARGVVFVVDATQGIGVFPLDMGRQGIDVLVFSGYKWATAGYGIAVLALRAGLLDGPLPMAGWRSAADPYALRNDRLALSEHASALELGHPLFPGIFALGGALRLFEEIGPASITARVLALTDYLHRRLDAAGATGVAIVSTRDLAHRSGITMLAVPDPAATVAALREDGILVAARDGKIRVGVHLYNDEADVDRLVDALGVGGSRFKV